jgi:hypothetical protein
LEQLKKISADEMKTNQHAREVPEDVDAKELLDSHNPSSVLSTVLNTISTEFQHLCLDDTVRLLNHSPVRQSTDDHVSGLNYSIRGLPATMILARQV